MIKDVIPDAIENKLESVTHFFSDFKTFALKGNVIDLAVGVIIGAAFGKIVTSLVDDIIMPPLGLLIGKVDFSELFVVLHAPDGAAVSYPTVAAAKNAGAVTWNYGMFLNTMVQFTIIAFAIFLIVSQIRRLQRHEEAKAAAAPPPPPGRQEVLLAEIRDLLKEQK